MNTSSYHSNDEATTPVLMGEGFAKPSTQASPQALRWLALGTIVGSVLFVLTWLVLGQLHPNYSPVSQYISDLELGPGGVLMRTVYVLNGLLLTVGTIAIFQGSKQTFGAVARWSCIVLLVLSPLGVLWDGIFTLNTLALHNLGVYMAASTPVIAFLIVGLVLRRVPEWKHFGTWMLVGCPLTLALIVGFTTSVPMSELVTGGGSIGLWQRALITEIQAWYVAMGWLAFRRASR
jgi:hypothetical membrane protein